MKVVKTGHLLNTNVLAALLWLRKLNNTRTRQYKLLKTEMATELSTSGLVSRFRNEDIRRHNSFKDAYSDVKKKKLRR